MTTLSETIRTCSDCGASFKPYQHTQKRCPDCIIKQGKKYVGHKICECKECGKPFERKASNQKYCSKECSHHKRYHLKRSYGLEISEFRRMSEACNNKCEICKQDNFDMSRKAKGEANLCVDHDHKTGKVRGLLCHNCNRALGLFQEDVDVMKRAIEYLVERAETIETLKSEVE